MNISTQNTLKHLHTDGIGGDPKAEDTDKSQSRKLQSYASHGFMSKASTSNDQMKTLLKSANPVNACYRESGQSKILCKANSSCSQDLHKETFEKKDFVSQSRYSLIIVSDFFFSFIQQTFWCSAALLSTGR